MGELSSLHNIGTELEKQLLQIGITTPDDLHTTGSKNAWLQISAIDPSACYMRLCALEGALQKVRWHNLPPETKQDLKHFYNTHKPIMKE